ncbi:MAG: hypothetical protein GY774_05130 [Planctomycetes bacterium]|nr:hypothetical protein [Planctomycetota bacterium]
MINNKTVLVLGAGASMPYGFPSGQGLVDIICDSDNVFKNLVSNGALVPPREVSTFINALSESDSESIDVFLGNNPEFEKVGKAAIAATLLPRERESELVSKWRELRLKGDKSKLGGHWYKYLSNLLLSDTSFEDFDPSKLSVVTFNYDRSLEHYLFSRLRASFYGKSLEEYAEKANRIKIIHIYGQLGFLKWQKSGGQKIDFGMGSKVDEPKRVLSIRNALQCIRTMGENFDENDADIKCARTLLSGAQNIYILGFGYHPISLKILGMESLGGSKNVRGTSLGLSFQRKVHLGRLDIYSLKWDKQRMNPRWLYDEDVYEFLHQHAILD